jgi:hypothetical protein
LVAFGGRLNPSEEGLVLRAATASAWEHYSVYGRSRTQRTCIQTSAATSLTHELAAVPRALRADGKLVIPNSDISHGCRWGISPGGIRLGDL